MKHRLLPWLTAAVLGLGIAAPAQASVGLWVQEQAFALEQKLAGLDTRRVSVGDHSWQIHTRHLDSDQPCLVMVHGFTARAAHWFRMARQLPEERCLIAVDLPGFGQSDYKPTADYSPATQAARLHELLLSLKLKTPVVDMVGNSMGGMIIAEHALNHPEQTGRIILMNAAGVSSPEPSTLNKAIEAGSNPFFAKDLAGFHRFYAMTMSEPPFVPGFVLDAVGEETMGKVPRHQYIFKQLQGPRLDDRLKDIKSPTLVVWGDQDQLLHVSMTRIWRQIPGARVFIFKGVGHMPHLERPAESADLATRFLTNSL